MARRHTMVKQVPRWVGCALLLLGGCAWAGPAMQPIDGIYTCVDAKGRKLTADRPIPECVDREQTVLNPSGTVRAKLVPALTGKALAEQEAKARKEQEAQAHASEEKRRDRALLLRYPNQAMHDKERLEAIGQIGIVKAAAANRIQELMRQRQLVNDEMAFYKKDPSKAPLAVRRQLDEVAQNLTVQGRFITDQEGEVQRLNARFDEELLKLRHLWALQAGATLAAPR